MSRSPSEVIISELTRIRGTLERFEQTESASKEAFNSLYAEMEEYKRGVFFELERSMLQDLLLFQDTLKWSLSNTTDLEHVQPIYDDFLDLLARYEVAPFPELTTFDSKLHRVLQVLPTEKPEEDNHIASVIRQGFYRRDTVLRIEDVVIYQFKPSE